jgi:glycosyltransferase involved in cell wall biosynthesis
MFSPIRVLLFNRFVSMDTVYLMDLWCQIPFYDAYLYNALKYEGIACTLGAVSFHREPAYFGGRGIIVDPHLCDVVSRLGIANPNLRRILRLGEFCLNLSGLALRFFIRPPGIIHVQWVPLIAEGSRIEWWFLKLAKSRGIGLVYTVHNVLPHDTEYGVKRKFTDLYRLMDALICHTNAAKERLVEEFRIEPTMIHVIPHGPLYYDYQSIDDQAAKRLLGLPPETAVVLYQGILRPYKGLEFLLDAWKNVQSENKSAVLIIAGNAVDKTWENVLRNKVADLDLTGTVRLECRYIKTDEMPLYYQAADVAVYPYREITQSGALMTGVSFGKTIIATNLPGFREALKSYERAFFVEYGDVNGLAQIIVTALQRTHALEMCQSKSGSEAFWRQIAKDTRRCYEQVLCGNQTLVDARSGANVEGPMVHPKAGPN